MRNCLFDEDARFQRQKKIVCQKFGNLLEDVWWQYFEPTMRGNSFNKGFLSPLFLRQQYLDDIILGDNND